MVVQGILLQLLGYSRAEEIIPLLDYVVEQKESVCLFYKQYLRPGEWVNRMVAFEEELFGPVAAFTTFETIEEAIALSNHNNFGLGVSFCTADPSQLVPHLHLIEDGAVFLNEKVMSDPRLPFGGTKKSGFGRELSLHGIREFVNAKTIYIR